METIIEEQEKEFYEKCDIREHSGGFTYLYNRDDQLSEEAIFKWHKEKVKQILQVLVEKTNDFPVLDGNGDKWKDIMSQRLFIQYLQEQIKKL